MGDETDRNIARTLGEELPEKKSDLQLALGTLKGMSGVESGAAIGATVLGKGGGRKDMAQGGGSKTEALGRALESVGQIIESAS